MHARLKDILECRRARLGEWMPAPCGQSPQHLVSAPPEDPAPAIRGGGGFLIAEIKRASPSRGLLAGQVDAAQRAKAYELGGADAVSVLCEPDFFMGSREDVRAAAMRLAVPVLCKDFVVDITQLVMASQDGAKWILLIARVLGPELPTFVGAALANGLEPLVEVHSERELEAAAESGARLIGVNARDLDTFTVDLAVVRRLAPLCPQECACIAESGIHCPDDLLRLRDSGAHGFLIGEALMRADDPESAVRAFKDALIPNPLFGAK